MQHYADALTWVKREKKQHCCSPEMKHTKAGKHNTDKRQIGDLESFTACDFYATLKICLERKANTGMETAACLVHVKDHCNLK